jgi:hypothetical protein
MCESVIKFFSTDISSTYICGYLSSWQHRLIFGFTKVILEFKIWLFSGWTAVDKMSVREMSVEWLSYKHGENQYVMRFGKNGSWHFNSSKFALCKSVDGERLCVSENSFKPPPPCLMIVTRYYIHTFLWMYTTWRLSDFTVAGTFVLHLRITTWHIATI